MARTSDGEERALAMSLSRKVSTRINESKVGRVASQTRKRNETELKGKRASCLTRTETEMEMGFLPVLNEGRREAFYSRRDTYDKYATERRVS
jgi:hypothetical protein